MKWLEKMLAPWTECWGVHYSLHLPTYAIVESMEGPKIFSVLG